MGTENEVQGGPEVAPEPAPVPAPAPQPAPAPVPMAEPVKPHTWKGTIAGVLLIISGLVGILAGAFIAFAWDMFNDIMPIGVPGIDMFESILLVCGIIYIILSLIVLLSGFTTLGRKSWGFAIVGCIFSILFTGVLLGIIALILVVLAKDEF
jgi:vacuolar-type H+-ATPase subunit I/STV1